MTTRSTGDRLAPAIAAVVAMFVVASGALAEFSHVIVRDVSNEIATPAALRTWRLFAVFTDPPHDKLLAVAGDLDLETPVVFETNDPDGLFNDGGPFAGTTLEDFARSPISSAWDSWVTIGHTTFAGNDSDYGPGFLHGDGVSAVITGPYWSDASNGWFDSEPGTAATGAEIAVAQFTVRAGYGVRLSGVVFHQHDFEPLIHGDVYRVFVHQQHDTRSVLAGRHIALREPGKQPPGWSSISLRSPCAPEPWQTFPSLPAR